MSNQPTEDLDAGSSLRTTPPRRRTRSSPPSPKARVTNTLSFNLSEVLRVLHTIKASLSLMAFAVSMHSRSCSLEPSGLCAMGPHLVTAITALSLLLDAGALIVSHHQKGSTVRGRTESAPKAAENDQTSSPSGTPSKVGSGSETSLTTTTSS